MAQQNPFPERGLHLVSLSLHQQGGGHTVIFPANQLGQVPFHAHQPYVHMPFQTPRTGSCDCIGVIQTSVYHMRNAPFNRCMWKKIAISHGTTLRYKFDPAYPLWAYALLPNGEMGWIGIHHLQAQTACIQLMAHAVTLHPFTQTWILPSVNSRVESCIVPSSSIIRIIGMTPDQQWVQLDTKTWIPSSGVQIL
jgi:hypothetical protein